MSETFTERLTQNIRETLKTMVMDGSMRATRSEILQSDEAARETIARMDIEFRSIDANQFRRITNSLDKKTYTDGGLYPWGGERPPRDHRKCAVDAIDKWSKERTHEHSEEYELDTPERREQKAAWKRKFGCRCAACGIVSNGDALEIHHYTYERLNHERDEDVCCVCSLKKTGRRCHILLDLAKEESAVFVELAYYEDSGSLFGYVKQAEVRSQV